jgi:hypothetical protein
MENQIMEGRADYGVEEKSKLVLRAIWGKQQGQLILCPGRDPITNKMKGVKTYSPDEARGRKRIVDETTTRKLTDGLELNLEDEVDAIDWLWMKECKEVCVSLDEAQQSHSALFYVEDLDREIIERVKLDDVRFEAKRLLKESSDFRKSEITKLLGREPKFMRPLDIADFLNELAGSKPMLVINTYGDEDYKQKLFLLSLIDNKIIHRDNNGFYKYEGIVLGVNEAAAIYWLKDQNNQSMVRQFQKMLNPMDYLKPSDPEPVKTEPVPDVLLEETPEIVLAEAPVIAKPTVSDTPKRVSREKDDLGPFKGTEAWDKLSPQAKGKINKARKNAK